MISAAGIMKPLPVRPVDATRGTGTQAPLQRPNAGRTMQPLPVPKPEADDFVDAIRHAAFQRMLDSRSTARIQQPLPVVDPTA